MEPRLRVPGRSSAEGGAVPPPELRRHVLKADVDAFGAQSQMPFQQCAESGADAARLVPPLVTASRMQLPVGAGTDAHRVANYNPFVALRWMLDGKSAGGVALRSPEETPDRMQALRMYTQGSAWFAHDEGRRGSLAPGKLADLAVLSKDYLTVPVGEVGTIESVLTMVGGRVDMRRDGKRSKISARKGVGGKAAVRFSPPVPLPTPRYHAPGCRLFRNYPSDVLAVLQRRKPPVAVKIRRCPVADATQSRAHGTSMAPRETSDR